MGEHQVMPGGGGYRLLVATVDSDGENHFDELPVVAWLTLGNPTQWEPLVCDGDKGLVVMGGLLRDRQPCGHVLSHPDVDDPTAMRSRAEARLRQAVRR